MGCGDGMLRARRYCCNQSCLSYLKCVMLYARRKTKGRDCMNQENYGKGHAQLLSMIESETFDYTAASRIIAEISDINQPILDMSGCSTTYLYEAETFNNVEAVRFLLENGADPNICIPDLIHGCPLVDLHFLWLEKGDEMRRRIEIAKLFFDFGADPNLIYEGETLYDHVLWEVFNGSIAPHDWEYIKRFFLLLVAYGGGGKSDYSELPELTEEIDKSRIDQYDFKLFLCEDSYHLSGHIFNSNGVDIGTV